MNPRNFKGTRDFLPAEMIERKRVIRIIEGVFERYGFVPLETPALEYLDILLEKYGEESEKLIYRLDYADGVGLRYDLTVPLSRVVAQHPVSFPFKRYQIQPVWRADRSQPNQGRFREFYQCDVDCIGTADPFSDAEILALTYEVLTRVEVGKFRIRLNHRGLLRGLMEFLGLNKENKEDIERETKVYRCLDKWDKVGREGVHSELIEKGFSETWIQKCLDLLSSSDSFAFLGKQNASARMALDTIESILNFAYLLGVPKECIHLDLALVRGLDYYTGTIYESVSLERSELGSLTGGGRYDRLMSSLPKGETLPSVGSTVGLDRILTLKAKLNSTNSPKETLTQVLIARMDTLDRSIELLRRLREKGFSAEIFYEERKLSKQLAYASKKKIPFFLILGQEELKNGTVSLKNLQTNRQESFALEQLFSFLKENL